MSEFEKDKDVERLIKLAGRRTEVPHDAAARVKAGVRDAWKSEVAAQRTRRRFIIAAPLAAAATIAFVLFLVTRRATETATPVAPVQIARVERVSGDARVTDPVMAQTEIVTGEGRAAIRMGDGTSLRIDRHSRVRLIDGRHFDLERGAIYVDAAQSGLEVRTPFGTVVDVGTKFEVRIGDAARVRVREGEVAIGNHHAHRGEQLDVVKDGSATMTRIDTWGSDWQWVSDVAPPLALEGKTVAQFLDWFASESGMQVRYDSPATSSKAASAILHGSTGALAPEPAVKAVLPTAGLRSESKSGVVTVSQQ